MKNILCLILGGGRGTRLYPLTKYRCKPAIPLAGKYRLIDIPISNCLNSGLNKIYVLTQFNSESLNKHINRTYKMDTFSKGFVEIIAAEQSMEDTDWFQGTADAVRRSLKHFNDPAIEYIFILSGDHLYSMDLNVVVQEHIKNNSEITVLCHPLPEDSISEFGIMAADKQNTIVKFVEKPENTAAADSMGIEIDGKKQFLASMGIYLFNKSVLIDVLSKNKKPDFGRGIIPDTIGEKTVKAFIYKGYWKDIGTVKAFYEENIALTWPSPPLDMFDERWQFFTRPRYLPVSKIDNSFIERSVTAEGMVLRGVKIKNSVIGLRAIVGPGSEIQDSIIMGADFYETPQQIELNHKKNIPGIGIGRNCIIKEAIIDKNVRVGDNVKIVNKRNLQDFEADSYCIKNGIVIIMKGSQIGPGTEI